MSDTVTETVEDEVVPFTEGDREIAYRSEAAGQAGPSATSRPAVVAPAGATGRPVSDATCGDRSCRQPDLRR